MQAAQAPALTAVVDDPFEQYQYIRPLREAADSYIDTITNADGRFMTGISTVDFITRGWGKGTLVTVFGSSHSGKSQFMLNALRNNPNAHVLWVTPDESSELVLAKMAAVTLGINAEVIEQRIKSGDNDMTQALLTVAEQAFPNTIVIDSALNKEQLWRAKEEAEDYWQHPIELMVYDYLEQFPVGDTDFGGVSQKILVMKAMSKELPCPFVVIHQSSRTAGDRGKPLGVRAMRFGGENESTFAIEVFRKMEDPDLSAFERQRAERQVSVNICKNKVPPCRKGVVDLYLDPDTGLIRNWHDEDGRISKLDEHRRRQAAEAARVVPDIAGRDILHEQEMF